MSEPTTRDREILKEILFQSGIEYLPQQKFDKCATILATEREKDEILIKRLQTQGTILRGILDRMTK